MKSRPLLPLLVAMLSGLACNDDVEIARADGAAGVAGQTAAGSSGSSGSGVAGSGGSMAQGGASGSAGQASPGGAGGASTAGSSGSSGQDNPGGSGGASVAGAGGAGPAGSGGVGVAGAGVAGSGGAGVAGSGGAGVAGAGVAGAGVAGSGGAGVAGSGGASVAGAGGASTAGSGGVSVAGAGGASVVVPVQVPTLGDCQWEEQLRAKADALTGAVLIRSDQALGLSIPVQPDNQIHVDKLTRVVAVTETHVLALGVSGETPVLVALGVNASTGVFSTFQLIDKDVEAVLDTGSNNLEAEFTPGFESLQSLYFLTRSDQGSTLKRLDKQAVSGGSTLVADHLAAGQFPGAFLPWQDGGGGFLQAQDGILWVRPGQATAEIKYPAGTADIAGLAVVGSDLFYAALVYEQNIAKSWLFRVPLEASGFGVNQLQMAIESPVHFTGYRRQDQSSELALLTDQGLSLFDPGSLQLTQQLTFPAGTIQESHLAYGVLNASGGLGHFLEVRCPNNFSMPVFLPQGSTQLQRRVDEPGFPFVKPSPWGAPYKTGQLHQNKHGIYLVK